MNYEEKKSCADPQSEHMSVAIQFTNEVIERFDPTQLNEIALHVKQSFAERRQIQIEETEKKLAYLKETLQNL